jgi:prostatic aicd phosphatase
VTLKLCLGTTKHYGAQALTNLGAQQNFRVGSDYRSRYLLSSSPSRILNISESAYVSSQVFASAPNQGILLNTATAFLQGLYPPLADSKPDLSTNTLTNGTYTASPLNGYQYVVLQGESVNSPDTIWIKGDENCPAATDAQGSFEDSVQFRATLASTKDFYRSFFNVLQSVYDYKSPDNMTYAKAFDIFDLINVARLHNATSLARNVTEEQLFQLRTLADSAEFGYNYNVSQPLRSIGAQTLGGAVLTQLNKTITSKGKLKISVLAANLTSVSGDFYGLADYASTMAFELFSADTTVFPNDPNSELRVRFLFRNSTSGTLKAFPLFGSGQDSLSWADFVTQMQRRAITTAAQWCGMCQSALPFCASYVSSPAPTTSSGSGGGMSNAVAGVIGAMVTLGVIAIVGALAFVLLRKRRGTAAAAPVASFSAEKTSLRSGSEGGAVV